MTMGSRAGDLDPGVVAALLIFALGFTSGGLTGSTLERRAAVEAGVSYYVSDVHGKLEYKYRKVCPEGE